MNFATPVIVNRRTGPRVATPIRSPTARSCFWAVPASTAVSVDPDGQRPAVSRSGSNRRALGRASTLTPIAESRVEIGLPLRSTSLAVSTMPPEAASTSGSAATRSSSAAGTVASPLADVSTTVLPEMTASAPV